MNKPCHHRWLALSLKAALGGIGFLAGALNAQDPAASYSSVSARLSQPINPGTFWHIDWHTGDQSDDEAKNAVAENTGRLQSIILPEVNLQSASLSDAIKYFREGISQHDPEPDVMKRGFNVYLQMPAGSLATDTPSITMHAENIPALDALREAAKSVKMKVNVESYAVSIVPLSQDTDRLFTADCSMSPELIGNIVAGRADMKPLLESKGIEFPPGSLAMYQTDSHRLFVRQTRANFEKIEAILRLKTEASSPTPNP